MALGQRVPGEVHRLQLIEIDGPAAPRSSRAGHRVSWTSVDPGFFEALGARIVAGRDFDPSDLEVATDDSRVAIVNEDFVRHLLEDRNAIGRRFRHMASDGRGGEWTGTGPWYEIVGVVEQIAMMIDPEIEDAPGYYVPLETEGLQLLGMAVRVGRDPGRLAPRVRRLAAEVSPDMLVTDIRPLDDSAWEARTVYTAWFWVVFGAGGIGVLLATVGIYSIMAFTVARRTREIGVRVALGAAGWRVLWGIFSRAVKQIGMGIAIGAALLALVGVVAVGDGIGTFTPARGVLFASYLLVMTAVCGLACIVPTARALAIQPTEALRADG